MQIPQSTGQVARCLNTTEPRVSDIVRTGKIQPPPEIVAGRRQWLSTHIFQAAKALGVLTPELEAALRNDEQGVPDVR